MRKWIAKRLRGIADQLELIPDKPYKITLEFNTLEEAYFYVNTIKTDGRMSEHALH